MTVIVMDNFRQLLVAVAALTLLFSAVSSANPNYFLGYAAYADDDEEDDRDNSGSSENEEGDHDDSYRHESDDSDVEHTVHAMFGDSSSVELEVDDEIEDNVTGSVEAELEIEAEDGDLPEGNHEVSMSCETPDMEMIFADSLEIEDDEGKFKTEFTLVNGTAYEGCEIAIGDLVVDIPNFVVVAGGDDDDYDDDKKERENGRGHDDDENNGQKIRERIHEFKAKLESDDGTVELEVEMDTNMTAGTYDVVLTCEEPTVDMTIEDSLEVEDGEAEFEAEIELAAGTYEGCKLESGDELIAELETFVVRADDDDDDGDNDVEEKRKEKRKEIVSRINAADEHRRRLNANPASTGDYEPRWNYTLTAEGTATARMDDDAIESSVNSTGTNSTLHVVGDGDVEVEIDMGVWKSNRALVLLSVLDGTVVVDGETYTVELGYALYSVNHDAMRIGAFVSDEDGNIYKLKLRGTATAEDAEFPMASGETIDMTFEGNSGPARNSFSAWNLELEGTVEAD